mmetsp:Transcript_41436/g.82984  ORF Transcript_41436/g.82984 Transcript_41436/m.82984 type:complete len:285 (-) Transcript_41436:172-1026(-)|eukprot:CAMPEP_0196752468 /NCGR_PEP_ID=MMETSP1091-20130531/87278_1 /TAXON_ID=302021 /ORGANISM="Rhodomonas sp., Strain CCMP768" /LENGTH=284 /DNA_ID=CAMNT_0042100415 /DNA_START=12 /DNA_END=866 /DNA_ORIENTATION=+
MGDVSAAKEAVEREEEALDRFQAAVSEQSLHASVEKYRSAEDSRTLLKRFLIAAGGNVDEALKSLSADLKWREEMQTLSLAAMSCDEVLLACKCPDTVKPLLEEVLPHGFLGFDKQGRPVTYRKITSKFDAHMLTEAGFSSETSLKYNAWMLERVVKAMGDRGQWVVVVDMAEWSLFQFTPSNMAFANAVSQLTTAHYPERMGKVLIINAPYVFGACWQVAKGWLNERILSKIGIYAGPDQWRPEVAAVMELELLPEELGGKTKLSYTPHSLDPGVIPPQKAQN